MKNLGMVAVLVGTTVAMGLGCGGRSAWWERSTGSVEVFGLLDAVAVVDPEAERVLLLTTDVERNVTFTAVPIQRGVVTVSPSPDRSKL
ncbi:MAG: hypothetical protein ABUR63_09250, partial [Verrucomicrobiota bacterium]